MESFMDWKHAAALAASVVSMATLPTAPAPAPDPVKLLAPVCPGGVGPIAGTSCLLLQVKPQGLAPKRVELRITEPNPDVPYLGTVLLCSGQNGQLYYSKVPGGDELIADLTAVGLRVLDRRWVEGWVSPSYQLASVSERLAVLLDWIHLNVHQGGAFFAVGNSGGSAELAYTLTTWNREGLFDAVVFGSGPTFTRLDYLCLAPPPAWSALCASLVPELECGMPLCTQPASPDSLCSELASKPGVDLLQDSILHPGADLSFPGVDLHFVIGASDCTESVPQALLFESVVTSPHSLQLVPGTPHTICESPQGREAIVHALLGSVPTKSTSR